MDASTAMTNVLVRVGIAGIINRSYTLRQHGPSRTPGRANRPVYVYRVPYTDATLLGRSGLPARGELFAGNLSIKNVL